MFIYIVIGMIGILGGIGIQYIINYYINSYNLKSSKTNISYPVKHFTPCLNGILWVILFYKFGVGASFLVNGLLIALLIGIGMIDHYTYRIPSTLNTSILLLGIYKLFSNPAQKTTQLLGFISMTAFGLLIYLITKTKGIGGGDIKLISSLGLILGTALTLQTLFIGCILASVYYILKSSVIKHLKTKHLEIKHQKSKHLKFKTSFPNKSPENPNLQITPCQRFPDTPTNTNQLFLNKHSNTTQTKIHHIPSHISQTKTVPLGPFLSAGAIISTILENILF